MEEEFAKYLIRHLLEAQFSSEEEMAEQLGISRRELADAAAGRCSKQTAARLTGQILRHCIRQKIPLDALPFEDAAKPNSPDFPG